MALTRCSYSPLGKLGGFAPFFSQFSAVLNGFAPFFGYFFVSFLPIQLKFPPEKLGGFAPFYPVCACLGFLHPFLWVYSAIPCAILGAWPYLKLLEKFPLPGMAFLTAAVFVGLHLLMGEGDWLLVVLAAIIAIVAESLRLKGGYASTTGSRLSYMAFSLMPLANTLRMWLKPEESMQITVDEMGTAYAEQMQGVLSYGLLAAMVVLTIALAFVMAKFFFCKK